MTLAFEELNRRSVLDASIAASSALMTSDARVDPVYLGGAMTDACNSPLGHNTAAALLGVSIPTDSSGSPFPISLAVMPKA